MLLLSAFCLLALPQPLAFRANPPPHCLLLFPLFRRQDLIDLLAGGLTNRGSFRARLTLRERRIRSQIFKLSVPDLEDGSDFCHLVVRQV
jgi:hypothetical protein